MAGNKAEVSMMDENPNAGREQEELKKWFVHRGVRPKNAAKFVQTTRCKDTADAALYLRFELAPLHLANADSVTTDMRRMFGCCPVVAKRIIRDLDVYRSHPFLVKVLRRLPRFACYSMLRHAAPANSVSMHIRECLVSDCWKRCSMWSKAKRLLRFAIALGRSLHCWKNLSLRRNLDEKFPWRRHC
jgi:hypothetical protein